MAAIRNSEAPPNNENAWTYEAHLSSTDMELHGIHALSSLYFPLAPQVHQGPSEVAAGTFLSNNPLESKALGMAGHKQEADQK
jgi:hypothetical protein